MNTIQLEAEIISDIGMDSILAEYHREMWKQYSMLWIDTSYGTASPDIQNTCRHLKEYIKQNCDMEDVLLGEYIYRDFLGLEADGVEICELAAATDLEGKYFRKQAVEVMKHNTGISLVETLLDWLDIVEKYDLDKEGFLEQDIADHYHKIMDYDGQKKQVGNEWITVEVENPVKMLDVINNKGILNLVLGDVELSKAAIDRSTLVSQRFKEGKINKGNWLQDTEKEKESWTERLLWQEYLLEYCGRYGNTLNKGALQYQLEYLIAGKNTDVDNLKSIIHRISGIREVSNLLYLLSDQVKCSEAEAMAVVLSAALMIPEAEALLKGIILLVWAYTESIYDVKCLLEGKKIPLLKTADSWHCSINGILNGVEESGDSQNSGLTYEDYLKILLALTDLTEQTFRMMDVVEMDIRQTAGNSHFRIDGCIDRLKANITIQSAYGYDVSIQKNKSY